MSILGIDLGGTKLAVAIFRETGEMTAQETVALDGREGAAVGELIADQVQKHLTSGKENIRSIGICIPGIYRSKTGTVWAPNIPGWEDYPLLQEISAVAGQIPVSIDSDRACYILGEHWKGNANECTDAIYMAVGTGIGAGILINGTVLRGADDIAGAVGWMALNKPFKTKYIPCGSFEYYASGRGIAKLALELMEADPSYAGALKALPPEKLVAQDIFAAHVLGDPLAEQVIRESILFWGMAVANLVSIFNPQKIILGGGVFGPAVKFIPEIKAEATKWAQPISITKVNIEESALGSEAGVYGAAFLALKQIHNSSQYAVN